MEISLEPKKDFLRDTAAREKHASIALDPFVHRTFAITIAEMHRRGLAPEEMAGVNSFISTWLNLGEDITPPRPMPNKHLKSWDTKVPPTTTTPPPQ